MRFSIHRFLILAGILLSYQAFSQISPGDLAEVHAHLEGMSNCTQCHILGDKVSNEKCLNCHKELKERIDIQKGYHASGPVKAKQCVECHNDHHGRNFQIIRFSEDQFDHNLTGYTLEGAHQKLICKDCHKPEFISRPEIRKKKYTYLGLQTACLACHEDQHQQTLPENCASCHDFQSFKPASRFDHAKTSYPLTGKHIETPCSKCHPTINQNNRDLTRYKGIAFTNCNSCHTDVHNNQFGQDCRQCHTEESFNAVKGIGSFDHNKTKYPLVDKHLQVNCRSCHKTKLTDPLRHDRCTDCHTDYHRQQFSAGGVSPDCAECHTTKGFSGSNYSIEKHNVSRFVLEGAHLATPCFACHKKEDRWNFREIGFSCKDCHPDIHQSYISSKYYPDGNCKSCHSAISWQQITFDHSATGFALAGAHVKAGCRSCHFKKEENGTNIQQFEGLKPACASCHQDRHHGQFNQDGQTDCSRCHQDSGWKIGQFNHDKTRFKLDGKHAGVACEKCHKPVVEGEDSYIRYKFEDIRCESCHL